MTGRSDDGDRDAIDAQASGWLVRLGEGAMPPEEEERLRQWRAADIRHERTFAAMQRTWADIGGLADLGGLVAVPPPVAASQGPDRSRRWTRFGFASMGGAAAAAAALFLVAPRSLPVSSQHFRTGLAQTRAITLPDGSQVTLGARSAIDVDFSRGERRVTLSGGEAFFEVAHDAARPFLVAAGPSIIRDVGTKFNVNLGDGSVGVSVMEGLVRIDRAAGGGGTGAAQLLRAGQRAELALSAPAAADASDEPAPPIVTSIEHAPGAWREGRLVYDNVRLADLVTDVNRYYAPGVVLETRADGDLRVTGSFKPNEIPAFMDALGATLPVSTVEAPDGGFRIGPRSG